MSDSLTRETLVNTLSWYESFYEMEIPLKEFHAFKLEHKKENTLQLASEDRKNIEEKELKITNSIALEVKSCAFKVVFFIADFKGDLDSFYRSPQGLFLQSIIEKGLSLKLSEVSIISKIEEAGKILAGLPLIVFGIENKTLFLNNINLQSFFPEVLQDRLWFKCGASAGKILFFDSLEIVRDNLEIKKLFWQQIKNL